MAAELAMFRELAEGRLEDVLGHDLSAAERLYGFQCHVIAGHAAIWSRDLSRAQAAHTAMSQTRPGGRWATSSRGALQAGIAALEGRARTSDVGYRDALESLRDIGAVRDVALVSMDRASAADDEATARGAADEARAIWQRLRADAMLHRLDELLAARATAPERAAARAVRSEVGV